MPHDAVATLHTTADSAAPSSAAPSTALPLSTTSSSALPTPALPTAGTGTVHTYSIPTTRNCVTPAEGSGGSAAAPDARGYRPDDSQRPTPGNELQSNESRQLQSGQSLLPLTQQPSQASHPQQLSQQHCQLPNLRLGSSAERAGLVPAASVPSGRTVLSGEDNRDGNQRVQLADPVVRRWQA